MLLKPVKGIKKLNLMVSRRSRAIITLNFIFYLFNINNCPKCWIINFLKFFFFVLFFNNYSSRPLIEYYLNLEMFFDSSYVTLFCQTLLIKENKKIKGYNRIGPHKNDILSIIFGSLLGKGFIEKKKDGTRLVFYQEAVHVKYLLYLHNLLANAGYCNQSIPKIGKKLSKKGKIYKIIKFTTWTYTSFDWIYDLWYVNGIKIVPNNISDYFTPFALAIWIMDSSVKSSGGLKFISCFSYLDSLLIIKVLQNKFGLKAVMLPVKTHLPANVYNEDFSYQYYIYIPKEYMINLKNKVSDFIIPEMKYKILPYQPTPCKLSTARGKGKI